MNKKRLLILQSEISSYNVSTYNVIAESFDLTVGYLTKDKSSQQCKFNKKMFSSFRVGPFTFVRGIRKYSKAFDVVCIIPNLRIPSYCIIPMLHHDYKVVSWSIGFRCSYDHPYITDRKHVMLDRLFQLILEKCDANIFYMEKSKDFWLNTSLRKDNIFVAPNTTDVVSTNFNPENKKDFLFVGTLYKGKGLDILFDCYNKFKQETNSKIRLIIVGGGEMEEELKAYAVVNQMTDDIIFTGPVYNEETLSKFFLSSILCFSPTQAGLSVPKSMGYGVPFVTRKDAITGGEIYHISNGVNGIMYSKDVELVDIMKDAVQNREKYLEMGRKAKEYYNSCATIKHMAKGAMDAFNY